MLKIRRPLGRLIFNMGIAIPGKTVFLIETAPRKWLCLETTAIQSLKNVAPNALSFEVEVLSLIIICLMSNVIRCQVWYNHVLNQYWRVSDIWCEHTMSTMLPCPCSSKLDKSQSWDWIQTPVPFPLNYHYRHYLELMVYHFIFHFIRFIFQTIPPNFIYIQSFDNLTHLF